MKNIDSTGLINVLIGVVTFGFVLDDRVAAVLDLDACHAVEHFVVRDVDVVAHADVDRRIGNL